MGESNVQNHSENDVKNHGNVWEIGGRGRNGKGKGQRERERERECNLPSARFMLLGRLAAKIPWCTLCIRSHDYT